MQSLAAVNIMTTLFMKRCFFGPMGSMTITFVDSSCILKHGEPSYEMADAEGKRRMRTLGYCRGLEEKSRQLGFEVLEVRRFEKRANPLNPTMALIIKKSAAALRRKPRSIYVCPVFKSPLAKRKGVMVAATRLLVYPIIDDIPCLRVSNAIVASHFGE